MPRSRSSSPYRPRVGGSIRWTPSSGWAFVISALGTTIGQIPITASAIAAGVQATVLGATLLGTGFLGIYGVAIVSTALYNWATSGDSSQAPENTSDLIQKERQAEHLDSSSKHVAICGPAGSGKSSMINALRGLRNNQEEAAKTGTVETTTTRNRYSAHPSIQSLVLHDCPGAGTLRVPAEDYYDTQKLYLFDQLLIIQGERLGEVEVATIKNCIRRGQRFTILRSRSDELINRIIDDHDLDGDEAKARHVQTTAQALGDEFMRAGVPQDQITELLGFCAVINKNDLRRLTESDVSDWPVKLGQREIDERRLLTALGKIGTQT